MAELMRGWDEIVTRRVGPAAAPLSTECQRRGSGRHQPLGHHSVADPAVVRQHGDLGQPARSSIMPTLAGDAVLDWRGQTINVSLTSTPNGYSP